jgi:hypothetical protein
MDPDDLNDERQETIAVIRNDGQIKYFDDETSSQQEVGKCQSEALAAAEHIIPMSNSGATCMAGEDSDMHSISLPGGAYPLVESSTETGELPMEDNRSEVSVMSELQSLRDASQIGIPASDEPVRPVY